MRNKKITMTIFLIFILAVIFYAIYTARFLIYGPRLLIDVPGGVMEVSSQVIEITGSAVNSKQLKINNKSVLTDQNGKFAEKMLLSIGTNVFVFDAVDKFGHNKSKTLQVIYTPEGDDVLQLKNTNNN